MEKALEEARRAEATAEEKAELARTGEMFAAGKEALKANDPAAAAQLFGQCEERLESWRKNVAERVERERAAAAARQAEEQRLLEERKAQERVEEAARREVERKRAEAAVAKNWAAAVWAAKVLGVLMLAGLLVWGAKVVATWCSRQAREAATRWEEQAREAAMRQTKDAVARMGQGTQAGEEKTIPMGKDAEMTFVWCPAGSFTMGSANEDNDEKPPHKVTLREGFWMAKTEVTQKQWTSVMGSNPSHFRKGDDYPVENVSWNMCQEFCAKTGLALPTEAQWEYACRAETTGDYGGTGDLETMGWYSENSGGETHPVGRKQPNKWGLYDMHGNVWEWCADWYGDYPSELVTDPTGPIQGSIRVYRGGSWFSYARRCRSAHRGGSDPGFRFNRLGLRVALLPVQ